MKTLLQKTTFAALLILFCLGTSQQVFSQTTGDYRTGTAAVTWATAGNWQTWNGTAWVTASSAPSSTNDVYVQAGHVATLGAAASCKNLFISSGTTSATTGTDAQVNLGANTLSINGKLASYFGTVSTTLNSVALSITATSTIPATPITMTAASAGKVSFVGNSRTIVTSTEWGAGNTASTTTFALEIAMNSGQTATMAAGIKAQNWVVSSGTLDAGTNRIAPDNGATGGGNFTLNSGATVISTATGTLGSAVIGRTSNATTGYGGTLLVNSGATLILGGASPTFAMSTITLSGTVQYNAAGTQTLAASTGGGVNASTYTTLTISGSGVKTQAVATTVTGTTTVDTGCTLGTGAFTFTNSGTANINGSFRIDQSGWGGNTGTYNYGTTGTLVFNNSSGPYGIGSGDTWWPVTNGPVNVTVQGGGGITMNSITRAVPASGTSGTFLLVTGTNAVQGTALNLNGTVQINGGNFQTVPTYGSSSTLIYNTTYGTSNEWTGGASTSVAAGSGVPANVQVLSGTLTLGGGRGVPGNVTVSSGAGMILNATSGDLYIGGNLTHSGTTWTNNTRAVVFVGTGTSVINTSANSGVQFFDYLLISKSSGSVQIGTTTNVTLNTTAGSVLQFLNAGTLDLNGRTLTMNNSGGNILVDGTTGGTTKSIISSTGTGTIAITNNKTASGTASGTLSTSSSVNWILTGGMNFGGVTTVNGTLQINAGGFVTTNAPIYGTGSLLKYNSAAVPFNRTTEWSASSGAGYPYNVQISNNTTLSPGGTGNTGTALNVANNLTIDSGSNLYMDYGGNNMTVPLIVNNDLVMNGNLSESGVAGGDVVIKGNLTRTGTFAPNGRAVFFQGTNAQSVTGTTTFDYVLIDKTGGSFTLNNDIIANQTLTFTATNTSKITTGSNKVQISSTGSVSRLGSGYVYGNLQKNIPTGTNSRTFEIGDSSNYTPVTLDYSGVTGAGNVIASTTSGDHPQIGTSDIDSSHSVNRYHTLTNSGVTGGSYDATFTFVAGDVDSGSNTSAFGVASYVNPTWTNATVSTRTSTTTKATGLTTYGDFQIGETKTTWTAGAGTTAWTTSGNWSKGVPSLTSNVTISTASFYPEISSTVVINRLTIDSGTSVTVKSGYNLTVTDAIANAGTLTVENNANLKQTKSGVSNTGAGSTIVNRDTATLMRQDYVLWSSPVSGQQLQAFSPQTLSTRFYTFDGSLGSAGQYVATSATGNFATGTGYLIRMPNNHPATPTIWNGTFTGGTANNGTYTQTGLTSGQYYAIGNPYPSTIDADLFIAGNSLTDALYFWRKTNNSANPSYATYTLSGGVGTAGSGDPLGLVPNGVINVGQGFIVKTGSTSLQFTNGMRITNNGNLFFRRSELERHRVWLNMSNATGIFCQTLVSYIEGATSGVDNMIDGRFLNDSNNALTSLINNEEFAIQGRPLPFVATDVVPLGFKVAAAGDYSIAIDHVDGLFASNQDILLKDNLTNTVHDLRVTPYTFSSEAGVFNTRFELVYENLLSVNPSEFTANNVIVYKQNQQVVIDSGKTVMSKVQIYDIRGRLLIEKENINASEIRMNAGTTNQVLLVKVTSNTNETVTKKIVN